MIRGIKRIEDFRIFQAWTPPAGAQDWEPVTVIYGVNGSGKSTLAEVLQDFAAGSASDGLRLEVEDASGRRTLTDPKDHFANNIHVFNAAYVRRNLRFDDPDNQVEPLLVLGEQAVDAAEQVAASQLRLAEVRQQLPGFRQASARSSAQAASIATVCATTIAGELGNLRGRWDPRSFNAAKVKAALAAIDVGLVHDGDALEADLALVKSVQPEALSIPVMTEHKMTEDFREANQYLQTSPTAQAIDALQLRPSVATWVQHGLELHQGSEQCFFCEGVLGPERKAALNAHFDESVRNLQTALRLVSGRVQAGCVAASSAAANLPASQTISPSLRQTYDEACRGVTNQLDELSKSCESLLTAISAKIENPFQTLSPVREVEPFDLREPIEILGRHNELCASFKSNVAAAAQRIEHERVRDIVEGYELALGQAETAQHEADSLAAEEQKLVTSIRSLEEADLDPLPLAQELNEDLERLLGRGDLSLAQAEKGFSVCRNGEPAMHLSEGERTALSLLYFIKGLSRNGVSLADAVVIVDDPVSSLDSNIVTGVSAHLWARLVAKRQCRQVVLFTHNFEFFRAWNNQLERSAHRAGIRHTTQELRIRSQLTGKKLTRTPYFVVWPQDELRRRLRSEYHYLFWRAGQTLITCKENPTLDAELDAAAVLPNICRRVLEGFLAFRYPEHIGDLREGLEAAIGGIDNSVTRTRVTTYLNSYSHNEEVDVGRDIARPESLTILTAVFELIASVDQDHFKAMCASLRLNADPLLADHPSSQTVG